MRGIPARDHREAPPEIAEHVGRRVLSLARVEGLGGPPLALRFEKAPHLARRRGDHESARRRRQESFGPIVDRPGQLDEAIADEGRFADQEVLGPAVSRAPPGHCVADPEAGGSPDHRVRDAVEHRISPARRAGLEHRTGDVPLQQVNLASGAARDVDELVGEKALARTRQPREEDQAPAG